MLVRVRGRVRVRVRGRGRVRTKSWHIVRLSVTKSKNKFWNSKKKKVGI